MHYTRCSESARARRRRHAPATFEGKELHALPGGVGHTLGTAAAAGGKPGEDAASDAERRRQGAAGESGSTAAGGERSGAAPRAKAKAKTRAEKEAGPAGWGGDT